MKTTTASKLLAFCLLLSLVGCDNSNSRVHPPGIDAATAGAATLELYDADKDSLLSKTELKKCPGLLGAMGSYDSDGDDKISASEIAERIKTWQASRIAMASLNCKVTVGGRPLAGAIMTFVPETYLGSDIKSASGTTDPNGLATIRVADADLPDSLKGIPGIHYGTFRVMITHPTKSIPAKYNTETRLGHEIAHDVGNPYANFNL